MDKTELQANRIRQQWLRDLDQIEKEIIGLLIDRQTLRAIRDIVNANDRVRRNGTAAEWMFRHYALATVLAIRRQLDRDSRSVSLANLLIAIRDDAWALSREHYLQVCNARSGPLRKVHDRDFDRYAGKGSHADTRQLEKQLREIDKLAEGVRSMANKVVAHADRRGVAKPPTYGDLDRCLDRIADLVRTYKLLLTGTETVMEPIDATGWTDVFRYPWLEAIN
jgi:hypothetical protein